ncbi:MAG TPA: 16S rRNA (guanine(966)-N(2))-methyltransferase RsmD [Syntrophales bacterium]|nr:16S rRNA (guanine(966)-N(2))-methyltransferase RsmD [Syntrophales bacterium]
MRIIGGEAKGKHIYSPKRSQTRPTSDGIKESLFNILQDVSGKSFIDLFAGSGNVGLEALSRGAAKVVFIEKNTAMANSIKRNIRELGFSDKCKVLAAKAVKGIRQLQKNGESFDFLFADPPYEKGFIREIIRCLCDGSVISQDGIVIIQHSKREDVLGQQTDKFVLTDQRRYGDTLLSFFKIIRRE